MTYEETNTFLHKHLKGDNTINESDWITTYLAALFLTRQAKR